MTISEVTGVGTCCGWNASLTMSGIFLTPMGTFWVVKPAGECNVMSLPVATRLSFMQVPGSTGSVRFILTCKVKHGLCVFEELLPQTDILMWEQLITFFRDTCLSLRSTWPGLSSNADGFVTSWLAKQKQEVVFVCYLANTFWLKPMYSYIPVCCSSVHCKGSKNFYGLKIL